MTQQIDDLEAVRILTNTLEKFDHNDQERIIRWAREKLGLTPVQQSFTTSPTQSKSPQQEGTSGQLHAKKDLKSFVIEKKPASDMQFAASVAYYYKFEAPETEHKDSIDGDILQDAARQAGRKRLSNPGQTLINANFNGMLDSTDEKGFYKINTVGENLVAMTLPKTTNAKSVKRKASPKQKVKNKNSSTEK